MSELLRPVIIRSAVSPEISDEIHQEVTGYREQYPHLFRQFRVQGMPVEGVEVDFFPDEYEGYRSSDGMLDSPLGETIIGKLPWIRTAGINRLHTVIYDDGATLPEHTDQDDPIAVSALHISPGASTIYYRDSGRLCHNHTEQGFAVVSDGSRPHAVTNMSRHPRISLVMPGVDLRDVL